MSYLPPVEYREAFYAEVATAIAEKGYCVLHHEGLRRLTETLISSYDRVPEWEFKPAGIGRGTDTVDAPDIRSDQIRWISGVNLEEQIWLQWMEGLRLYLNRRLFLGLFTYESHYAHYQPGAFYAKHHDAFVGQANRVLSTVFYLNRHWYPDQGGELVLYEPGRPEKELKRVFPQGGTLVVFLSEEFPHEVLPSARDRYSIAGWFRVNSSHHDRVDPPR